MDIERKIMTNGRKFAELRRQDGSVAAEIIVPNWTQDGISIGLRVLTHQLQSRTPEDAHGGGCFGGAFGYGVDFENDVFEMHPDWQGDCTCGADPEGDGTKTRPHDKTCRLEQHCFLHKPTGLIIDWYKYIGRDNEVSKEITLTEWTAILEEVLASIGASKLDEALSAYAAAEKEADERMAAFFKMMQSEEGMAITEELINATRKAE